VAWLWRKGNKGSRRQAAAIHEKEEGNRDRHQRVELKTAITSGKRRTDLQDPQEDPRVGIHEASKWAVKRVSENEEMNLVERLGHSETKKEIIHRVGAGNVGAPATRDSFAPPKKERNR
jgi:hypothetical protein